MSRRILYVQYANPACYPPLEHSSRILADAGWEVLFLGTGAFGADSLKMSAHSRIRIRRMPFCSGGWFQKLHYAVFSCWVWIFVLSWRPHWVLASDRLSCPAVFPLTFFPRMRILYQEHDPPEFSKTHPPLFAKAMQWARRRVARRAAFCIVPNQERRRKFSAEMNREEGIFLVWNCPGKKETGTVRKPISGRDLTLFYHGSSVPSRLPLSVLEVLRRFPESVRIRIFGYSTIGHPNYVDQIKTAAQEMALGDRVRFMGAVPGRQELLQAACSGDVGLSLMPTHSDHPNEQAMEGASNKPFEYLACGLALLVTDLPGWKRMYVDPGYGLACNPDDLDSLEKAIRWFLDHPVETRQMGESGRKRILADWNYETQFIPVFNRLNGAGK